MTFPTTMVTGGHKRERITRRLEAFSDIVIGFSLAQLGLSLVIPPHAVDFVQRPVGIVAFLVTFLVVVRFWWTHFTIFEHYFEPTRIMMVLNFSALASLILQVFSLQVFLHFVPLGEGVVASRIYFGLFVLSYGMLCAMLALGLHYRWSVLPPDLRLSGIRSELRLLGVVAGCALGNAFTTNEKTNVLVTVAGHTETIATLPQTILLYAFVGWLVGVIAARFAPRFFRKLLSAA